jgi:glutathione peroxidase
MIQFLITTLLFFQTSFYTLGFSTTDGTNINMIAFAGKKVLIVNIATNSKRVSQLGELEQLQQKFHDSLIIIAFPSNSFGNEEKNDEEIQNFCRTTYNTKYLIAAKSPVTGNGLNSIYNWISSINENGNIQGQLSGDFQKFLIDENGKVVGVFAPSVGPLDDQIVSAIRITY